MPVDLYLETGEKAHEGGSLGIVCSFAYTAEGVSTPWPPKTIKWSLHDVVETIVNGTTRYSKGALVNSRQQVDVSPPSVDADGNYKTTIWIYGDDLAIAGTADIKRVLTIEWTFDLSGLSDVPENEELWIDVENRKAIPIS